MQHYNSMIAYDPQIVKKQKGKFDCVLGFKLVIFIKADLRLPTEYQVSTWKPHRPTAVKPLQNA